MKNNYEEILVSILIPAYNVEKYIDRCLDSVVKQTHRNIEIILVVQPSKDKTIEIAERWERQDSRIKIVYQKYADLASARNNLLSVAKGEYICFVDSDDMINCVHVKRLLENAILYNADIVQGKSKPFKVEESLSWLVEEKESTTVYSGKEFTYRNLMGLFGSDGGVIQTKLYKKTVMNGIRFPEYRLCEDSATVYKITWQATKIVVSDEKTYYYQSEREDSIIHSRKGRGRRIEGGVLAYLEQIEFFMNQSKTIYYQVIYNMCNELMRIKVSVPFDEIQNEDVLIAINNRRKYTKIAIKGTISKRKKVIVILDYYIPHVMYIVWKGQKKYRYIKQWGL